MKRVTNTTGKHVAEPMDTIQLRFPAIQRIFIDRQVRKRAFKSRSDYLRDLVRRDMEKRKS